MALRSADCPKGAPNVDKMAAISQAIAHKAKGTPGMTGQTRLTLAQQLP
jgi:hypothetical protein